jgi:hypothetical protein
MVERFFVTVAIQTLIWINRPLDRLILTLLNLLAGVEPNRMISSFPARVLKDWKRFVIDVGEDGFNGYLKCAGRLELVAAGSAISTYTRMMQDMIKLATGTTVVFQVNERESEEDSIPGWRQKKIAGWRHRKCDRVFCRCACHDEVRS